MEENAIEIDRGHDYCSVPEPAALDLSLYLQKQLEQAKVNSRFGLQRFAGFDEDIRFYT
ncbi:hypothetical protein ABG768_018999, partial [Culter alburnus]